MNYIIGIQQIPYIFVADLYFMHEGFLAVCAMHREYARDYIVDFMVANKDKEAILVPYHPLGGRAVLIILYPRYSHALYLDSSKNMNKKDYTHIKSVLDGAIFYYDARGGEIKDKKKKDGRPAFSHKTDFCCIQQPSDSLSDGFYVLHHMLEYIRDHQDLRMSPKSGDAHILQWAKNIGDTPDHRLQDEFYHIQHELAQVIMKEVLDKTGMFYEEGQMKREDVRTRLAAQGLDLKPSAKLGDYLPELDGWNDMLE
ncbi:hypothetical protein VPH35_034350 [Triticum aestivum]